MPEVCVYSLTLFWICCSWLIPTAYEILQKSMIYVYFTSCFNLSLLFSTFISESVIHRRIVHKRKFGATDTYLFSLSYSAVRIRCPANNMFIAAFISLSCSPINSLFLVQNYCFILNPPNFLRKMLFLFRFFNKYNLDFLFFEVFLCMML